MGFTQSSPNPWSLVEKSVHRTKRERVSQQPAGKSIHPFGGLATRNGISGPIALRPRLTTSLPLSRMMGTAAKLPSGEQHAAWCTGWTLSNRFVEKWQNSPPKISEVFRATHPARRARHRFPPVVFRKLPGHTCCRSSNQCDGRHGVDHTLRNWILAASRMRLLQETGF